MKTMWLSMLFFSLSVLALPLEIHASQTALDKFLVAYDQTKIDIAENSDELAVKARWLFTSGPWQPYLHRPFEDGLSAAEHRLYMSAQVRHDCENVAALDRIGFLNFYPFLTDSLSRKDISNTFDIVSTFVSRGHRRCLILKELSLILAGENPFNPFRGPHNLLSTHPWDKESDAQAKVEIQGHNSLIILELHALIRLAFCEEYRPAFKDLLEFTKPPHLLKITPEQTYRLIKEARYHGVSTEEFDDSLDRIAQSLTPAKKAELDLAIDKNKSNKLLFTDLPISGKTCLKPPLWVRSSSSINTRD